MISHQRREVIYFTFPILDRCSQLVHAVSSRVGGVSEGIYHSLNVGFHVGDDESNVLKNREILCQALGLHLNSIVAGEQVHGTHVAIVQAKDRGKGAYSWKEGLSRTDGLITNIPNISLLVVVADCPVVLLFDPTHKVIGLAHSGWRGSINKIAQKTVRKMNQHFHTNPQDLLVGISPSIGPCCYKIGEVILKQLVASFPENWENFITYKPDGSFYLDMWKLNEYQLLKMGVKGENIEIARICSACYSALFYSHRAKKGKTGRYGVIISM